ncbi:YCF48-related protein [Daejeonella sp. H1SJ63]|uniref:WD40/YVTN/BNR-like repeat-containing protein n=1 Tax=Daejeonella sp. H1SJ63 TaxID=3034145 RepID=UPI0023EBAB9D|nr:YCF48-related protein [Daejeonella sp. H1SJ63]
MKEFSILFLTCILFSLSCKKDKNAQKNMWVTVLDLKEKNFTFRDVDFLNENTGYALALKIEGIAGNHTLWRTDDGGKTWASNNFYLKDDFITNISAVNDTLFGSSKQVYHSDDNGLSWKSISPSLTLVPKGDIVFSDTQTGTIIECNSLFKTTNRGETWKEVFNIPYMSCFSHLFFTSNKTAYAIGGSVHDNTNFGFIAKSEDEGQNWKLLEAKFANITDCYFLNDKTGFVFTFNEELFKTTDGGNNWKLINNKIELYPKSFFLSEKEGYYGGMFGIFHTTDGGLTWKKEYTTNEGDVITDITFKGKTSIVITSKGLILRKQI